MKKIIAITLMLAMLICGCGKAENTTTELTNASSEPTEGMGGTESAAEPTEAPTEEVTESSSEVTDPEPDPYAEIKANPLPLLDMTFGEVEETYGKLEIKEYRDGYTGEAYSPTLDMYLEVDGRFYRSQGVQEEEPIFGVFVNELGSLGVKAGMKSNEIDLSDWDLTINSLRITLRGEEWYEPAIDGSGPVWNHSDDFQQGHTLNAFKEQGGYWYYILFHMPEEYEEYIYDAGDSYKWQNTFIKEFREKKRSLTVARIFVRKEGSISL